MAELPWVSGADQASAIVIGEHTLPDMLQALFVLPTDRPGVSILPPLDLSGAVPRLPHQPGAVPGSDPGARLVAGRAGAETLDRAAGGLETSSLALG